MRFSPRKINAFLLFRLPAAFLCGVRVASLESDSCTVSVTHRWINQNPFRSMYFAVQAMAAELTTGLLIIREIRESGSDVSMLIVASHAAFFKKATGKITFKCANAALARDAVKSAVTSNESQEITMRSTGCNSDGEVVSELEFQWKIKIRR